MHPDFVMVLNGIRAAQQLIDWYVTQAQANSGYSPEMKQQILEAANVTNKEWDDEVEAARRRLADAGLT